MKKTLLAAACCLLSLPAAAQTMMMSPPPQPMMVAPRPYCHPYTDKFTIGHDVRVTRGMACLQPDGSWQLQPSSSQMRYVARGNGLYLVPAQPFVSVVPAAPPAVVVIDEHHHHHY